MTIGTEKDALRHAVMRKALQAQFRETTEGYVFRAPNPAIVLPAKQYLVSAAEKDALIEALAVVSQSTTGRLLGRAAIGLLLLILPVSATLYLTDLNKIADGSPLQWLIIAAAAVMLTFSVAVIALAHVVAKRQLAAIKPLLASARPTKERVTLADMQWQLQANADPKASRRGLVVAGVINAVMASSLLLAAYLKWKSPHVQPTGTALSLFFAALGAIMVVRCGVVLARAKGIRHGICSRAGDRMLNWATFATVGVFMLAMLVQVAMVVLTPAAVAPAVRGASGKTGIKTFLAAGQTLKVPTGTIVSTPQGNLVTLNGHGATLRATPGSIVIVPAGATGAADNVVIADR